MTVSSSTNRVSYSGNGTLTTFAYTFKIFDEGDLTVILRAANGTETVQTITTHYTVTGAGSASGGNVEFVTAPSATETVVILREQDLTQGLDLVPNDPFPAQSLEESLDKLVFMVQQHEETLGRTIKASKTNEITGAEFTISAADRANKIFAFDGSGDVNITQAVGVYRGDWAASTSYAVRDIVKDTSNNNIYIANTAHTSSGSTPLSSNADIAKWDLLVDAASATASAAAAAASETAAETAQTAAEAAQTAAETAQTAAETAETNAETAETNAETAQAAAEAAQAAAELAYDNFDDRYLGAKSSDPTLDNDGDALIDGALYFDTTNNVMKVYDLGGTAWNRTTPTSAEQTNIDTVSGISANVTTVAGISGDVTTVSGISSDVTTVAADGTDIGVVAGISANVTTVAGISSNVTTVAGISSDVTTVAADGTDIGTVATNIANVNTVAGISGNVTTVAGISADVTSVAADATDIGSVAGSISNVNTVATNLSNINTVAGISSNVTSVAGISSDVTTVANNLSDVSSFANLYRIAASDPTTSLDEGDLYYNTTNDEMKVYNGSAWQAVAPTATSVTVSQVSDLTATAAEINQLDGTADLPDIRPSLLLDFANSKTLDPRITFTRGSTATYWDGKTTAKAEENLLKYSQDLTNAAWSKGSGALVDSNNTTAPDGTTTADRIYSSSGDNYFYIRQTFSFPTSSSSVVESFDLTTGAFQTSSLQADAKTVESVGNSWYRISITYDDYTFSFYIKDNGMGVCAISIQPSNNLVEISTLNTYTNFGDITLGVYIWGAQLEQRSSATAYTATTSSPIVKYQPVLQTAASGEARFDHDPVTGESKGLLIEEARTNLETTSVYSGNTNVIITTDATIAPDGTQTGILIQENTSNALHRGSGTSLLPTANTRYTFSVYIKNYEGSQNERYFYLNLGATIQAAIGLDLSTMTINTTNGAGSPVSSIEEVGNGWYRLVLTGTSPASPTTNNAWYTFRTSAGTGDQTYTGDGFSGFYIWGAQLEEGSFPTSYIPTSGSTVTRSGDLPIMSGSNFTDWFNSIPFSGYVEYDFQTSAINQRILSIDTNSFDPRLTVVGSTSSKYGPSVELYADSNFYFTLNSDGTTPTETGTHKIAFALADNDAANSKDGATVVTDTSFVFPNNFSQLRIGSQANGVNLMQGTIKKIAFYPKRLPNATLQAMTEE